MNTELAGVTEFLNEENLKDVEDMKFPEDASDKASVVTNFDMFDDLINQSGSSYDDTDDDPSAEEVENSGDPSSEKVAPTELTPDEKKSYHHSVLTDIKNIRKDMTDMDIKTSSKIDEERLQKNIGYAEEVLSVLQDEFQENTFATGIREIIIHTASIVPAIFDGEKKIFGKTLPDMTGYDKQVRSKIGNINRETIKLARSTREAIGENAVSVFQVVRTLGIPFVTTYISNNVKTNKYDKMNPEDYEDISDDE
jgi:hypothetical protein